MSTADTIRERLIDALGAEHVEVEDESALHRGHAGARGGAGHFRVRVIAQKFADLDRLARHRAVYGAVSDLMPREIHALSAETFSPEEWRTRPRS